MGVVIFIFGDFAQTVVNMLLTITKAKIVMFRFAFILFFSFFS